MLFFCLFAVNNNYAGRCATGCRCGDEDNDLIPDISGTKIIKSFSSGISSAPKKHL